MLEPRVTWLGSAGYAALGSLATIAVLGVVALLVRLALGVPAASTSMTPVARDVQAFHSDLGVVVIMVLMAQILLAVLLALPVQATALLLRRSGAGGLIYAQVSGLTLLASLVSFALLYPALSGAALLLEADLQALLFAIVFTLLYVVHAVSLVLGRRFARTA